MNYGDESFNISWALTCRTCKHWRRLYPELVNSINGMCEREIRLHRDYAMNADDFCSRWEEK